MKVGIIELLTDAPCRTGVERLYARYFRKQFMSLMPQVVAVWCRQLGHQVSYATYYGQTDDPRRLLPDDLDVVFVAAYTQVSALAYALAKLYRRDGTRTVIGGPHARSFPVDCARFFDLVVEECDKPLIEDILRGRFDAPAIVTSGRPLTDIPSVEERLPEIVASGFYAGKRRRMSLVPMLSSVGCPYRCDFCLDWDSKYMALPRDQLAADLAFMAEHLTGILVAFHDPNFGVRFDETMDLLEAVPARHRSPYIMESSLSVLKPDRMARLRTTNCVYVAPGIESWSDYANKAGVGAKSGQDKLDQVVAHFELLQAYVPGLQANFLFGTDADRGEEPVELTKAFIRRLPRVFPTLNIPTPFGGTPLFDKYLAQGRILKSLPFAFYYNPYLAATLKNYDPVTFYDHVTEMHRLSAANIMLAKRLLNDARLSVRLIHGVRTLGMRRDTAHLGRIKRLLAQDPGFRAFHEGRTDRLPEYYHRHFEHRLGPFAELLSQADRTPVLNQTGTSTARPGTREALRITAAA